MYIGMPYNKGLPQEILKAIEGKQYSVEELIVLHGKIKQDYANKAKGYARALVAMLLCAGLVLFLGLLSPSTNPTVSWILALAFAGILLVVATFLKRNWRDKCKRQFVRAVQKGYPELAGDFDDPSFR